jgi:FtsH-binding integral membrane protein
VRGIASFGLLVSALGVLANVLLLNLDAIASIGSAVALAIFFLVTLGHLRIRHETNARLGLLVLALLTTGITLLTFTVTTLIQEPRSIATLVLIVGLSVLIDVAWSRQRRRGAPAAPPPAPGPGASA